MPPKNPTERSAKPLPETISDSATAITITTQDVQNEWRGEAGSQLHRYCHLLVSAGRRQNLVGNTDPAFVSDWLIGESIASWLVAGKPCSFADIGSGAGLPGLVWAILSGSQKEGEQVLLEPRAKRAAFLRMVIADLGLTVRVVQSRVEDVGQSWPLITSRAVFPAAQALACLSPYAEARIVLSGNSKDKQSHSHWRLEREGCYAYGRQLSSIRVFGRQPVQDV